MSWTDYFKLGFGGTADGSTYINSIHTATSTILDYTQPPTYTVTTYFKRVSYHPASYSKRWKR